MFSLDYWFYLLIIAISLIVGLVRCRNNKKVWAIIFLLALTLCSEIVSVMLAYIIKNNCCVYHFFNPLQAIVWGCFFYVNIDGPAKKTVMPLLLLLLLYSILNTMLWQDMMTFPGNFIKFECLVLLFWSFSLFIEFLDRPSKEEVFGDSVYVICIAVIWFNLISYVFFELFNSYIEQNIATDSLRTIHHLSNYIYYSLLLIAMLLGNKPTVYEQK